MERRGCLRKFVDKDGGPVVFVIYLCSTGCYTEAVERLFVRRRLLKLCKDFRELSVDVTEKPHRRAGC